MAEKQIAERTAHSTATMGSRIARDSTAVFVSQVVLLVCGVANNFLVARIGGPEGKGMLYLLQLVSTTSLVLLHLCLGSAAIYYLAKDRGFAAPQIASGVLVPSLAIGLLPGIAAAISWPWTSHWMHARLSTLLLVLLFSSIPMQILAYNGGQYLLGRKRVWAYNLSTTLYQSLFCVMLVVCLVIGNVSIQTVAALWIIGIAAPTIFVGAILLRATGRKNFVPDSSFLRKAWQFSWRSHLGGVTQFLQHRLPVLMVGYFLPLKILGLYSFAISVAELLWYAPNAISIVLMPHVAGSTHEEATRVTSVFCRITVWLTLILAMAMAVAAYVVVPWLLPAFRPSLVYLWVLLPGVVIATVFRVLASDLNGRGEPLKTFYPAVLALAVEGIAGIILIPRYGALIAAVITCAGYLLNTAISIYIYQRLTNSSAFDLIFLNAEDFKRCHNAAISLPFIGRYFQFGQGLDA